MLFFRNEASRQVKNVVARYFSAAILVLCTKSIVAQSYNLPQQNDRWAIKPDGSIEWKIDTRLPHQDHIEMSGEKVSLLTGLNMAG